MSLGFFFVIYLSQVPSNTLPTTLETHKDNSKNTLLYDELLFFLLF